MKRKLNPEKVVRSGATVIVTTGAALLIVFAFQIALWASQNNPPFTRLSYKIPPVKAGDTTIVQAVVKRDLTRRCAVIFSRMFFDSAGTRWELTEGAQLMNRTALAEYDARSPNALAFSVTVPPFAKPGKGTVMTVLDYYCNPVHQSYPIPVVLTMNMEVLP